jgi:sugar phosphate isomerase/epimerase
MHLSCGDHSFPLLDHELVLDLIAGLGFTGFDLALAGNRSHIRPEHIRGDIPGAAKEISKSIRRRGLELSDVFCIPWTTFDRYAPNHPDASEAKESRALFEDVMRFTELIDAPGLTMVPGIVFDELGRAGSLERAAEELHYRAERMKEIGKRFSVECHIGSVAANPEDVLNLLEMAPALRLTLDYTHFVAQGFSQESIDRLVPHAGHMQIRGGRPGRGQCGMRDNTIDYEAVIDRLQDAGYDGGLAVEYVWIDWEHMNECDNVSETIMMRDRLRAKLDNKPWSLQLSPT